MSLLATNGCSGIFHVSYCTMITPLRDKHEGYDISYNKGTLFYFYLNYLKVYCANPFFPSMLVDISNQIHWLSSKINFNLTFDFERINESWDFVGTTGCQERLK